MNHHRRNNMICPYEHYYSHQAGSGIGIVYKGVAHQRGHGIGSFLGGLFRSVLPLLTSGAKVVGKEVLNAGMGLLFDAVSARPMDEAVRTRFKEATGNLKRKADNKFDSYMSGSGYKIKRLRKRAAIKPKASQRKGGTKKRKIDANDIFSN